MAITYPPVDETVAYILKKLIDNKNKWPSHFVQSKEVYCVNPWNHFDSRKPLILHEGKFLSVNRKTNSGKTDGCESGCWRVIGRDKLIKSDKTEKILGFKKILKFCDKEKRISEYKIVWVMEEFRLANTWKQDYVICKIRLWNLKPLGFMISNHVRGYNNKSIMRD